MEFSSLNPLPSTNLYTNAVVNLVTLCDSIIFPCKDLQSSPKLVWYLLAQHPQGYKRAEVKVNRFLWRVAQVLCNVQLVLPQDEGDPPLQLKFKRLDWVLWNLWSQDLHQTHTRKKKSGQTAAYLSLTGISKEKNESFTYRIDLWPL